MRRIVKIQNTKLGWIGVLLVLALPVNTAAQNLVRAPLSGPPIWIKTNIVSPEAFAQATQSANQGLELALGQATKRVAGWQSLPKVVDYKTALDTQRPAHGSISMGTVGSGLLINGSTLGFVGEHYEIIERHRRYGTAHATDELLALIRDVSRLVDEVRPGAPLRVGNMSRSKGGDIRWSRSHNSGRDADLAFYVQRIDDSKSVTSPGILRFDAQGRPVGYPELTFDVERNWLLVRGMLEHEVTIQYLFISLPLKAKLLEFARKTGEPETLIAQAEKVLHQPTDALPHDDHFHLRIACSKDDRLRGCIDAGPRWDWRDWHDAELLAQALEFARGLKTDPNVDIRLAILDFLGTIRSPFASEVALTVGVYDSSAVVRERAWQVARYTFPWTATTIIAAEHLILEPRASLDDKIMAYSILRRSADPEAHAFALRQLERPDVSPRERVFAARTLRHTTDPALVSVILAELERQPARVRVELADVLRRLTNRTDALDWAHASEVQRTQALRSWQIWHQQHTGIGRDIWVLEGMQAAGLGIKDLAPEAVDALLHALTTGDDYVVYNANRLIRKLTGRWAPLEQSDGRKLHKYWSKWWKKNRERVMAKHAQEG